MSTALLLFSLLSVSLAFIHDSLSQSFIPFVQIQDLPPGEQFKREILVSHNEYIPSGQYQIGCSDDQTITFYDPINSYSLLGSKQADFEVMCAGSVCIASRDEQIIAIPDISATHNVAHFDALLQSGNSIIFDGDLPQQQYIHDVPQIDSIYEALESSTATFLIISAKLASGGDYWNDECMDKFHLWAMYLAKPFQSEISDPAYQQFVHDANCIVQDINTNAIRPTDLQDVLTRCPNTHPTLNTGNNTMRRLVSPALTCQHIKTFKDRSYVCPLGGATLNVQGNPVFGRCGRGTDCWTWICAQSKYNDWSYCGCRNGCFVHDYACTCRGTDHIDCINFPRVFNADKTCHAGSTCIAIHRLDNIAPINSRADINIFGSNYGEPYVEIVPKEPSCFSKTYPFNCAKRTKTIGQNFRGNEYNFGFTQMCWTMRFEQFYIRIKDEDITIDGTLYGVYVYTPNNGKYTVGSGTGYTPKITISVQKSWS